jgi:hypothetical protein
MSETTLDKLTTALASEFKNEVVFASAPPSTVSVPSVIVSPADPFLLPWSHGGIQERWDILVAVSLKNKTTGLAQMRDISLRVHKAVNSVGATWHSASGPRRLLDEKGRSSVISANLVTFQYPPPII